MTHSLIRGSTPSGKSDVDIKTRVAGIDPSLLRSLIDGCTAHVKVSAITSLKNSATNLTSEQLGMRRESGSNNPVEAPADTDLSRASRRATRGLGFT